MANERARGLGYKFVTDDKYLVNPFSPTEGISYEGDGSPVSYANSGIMTQAPAPLQYIPQGGNDNNNDDDNINSYTGPSVSPWEAVKQAGMFMMNPLGFVGSKAFGAYQAKQKEKTNAIADANYKAQRERDAREMIANPNNPDGSKAAYNYAGRDNAQGTHTSTKTNKEAQENQDKGRGKYFFGGRVNYKVGGRTDAESQYGADSAGSYDSSQNQSGREQSYGGGNDNPSFYEPKPSFFNNPEILSKETIIGDVPMGIGFDNSYGRYKATMDLEESFKEKGLEGEIEYNNNIGNFDLAAKYNTQDGPSYGAGYTGNNFDVGVNNKTGASVNYSKDIGPGTLTAGVNYGNDGTFQGDVRYGINFANGGLASIL